MAGTLFKGSCDLYNDFTFCWPCISVRFLLTTNVTYFL